MFSGIIEASSPILTFQQMDQFVFRLKLKKPVFFSDLKVGDSIAVNGVCLTLVNFDQMSIEFDVAKETLEVTNWNEKKMTPGLSMNLERSLKFGDRVHGHFLSGHVDDLGQIKEVVALDDSSLQLKVLVGETSKGLVWKKSSIGLSGVSLTVNEFRNNIVEVGLIPETLNLTNLKTFRPGDTINVEYDWMAKAIWNQTQQMKHKTSLQDLTKDSLSLTSETQLTKGM